MLQEPQTVTQEDNGVSRLLATDRFVGSLGLRVYHSLRHAILTLALRPGEILRKPEICEHLGVSRSPVSDAVARLAADGLVDVVPQAGTFVTFLSMSEIRAGAFIREAIEVATAVHMATVITDDQLRQLRRNLVMQEALVADGDHQGFMQLDMQMHELLLSFTGFPRLSEVSDTAWLSVHRARQSLLPFEGRMAAALREHQAILAALEAHDPEAARGAVQFHLRQLLKNLAPLEHERPELFSALPERA